MPRRLVQSILIVGLTAGLMFGPLTATLAGPTAGGYHWARSSSPFTLQVGDNVDGSWDGILQRAVTDWNENGTVRFQVLAGQSAPQDCRPVTGRVEVCNGTYGTREGWLGMTRLVLDAQGEHIEAATMQMNDSFFVPGSVYNTDAARQHTMCHELGHTPGLDHVATESCMNDSDYSVFHQVVPIKKDFAELERLYQHQDASTTVLGEPAQDPPDASDRRDPSDSKGSNTKKTKDKRDTKGNKGKHDKHDKHDTRGNHGKGGKHTRRHEHAATEDGSRASDASEPITVETLPDGRMVVTYVTWAADPSPPVP